jgi:type I restriction enzyme S subunit
MELTPGYKQTEVGVIPKDWTVKSVHEFATVQTGPFGTLLKAAEYSLRDGVPLISVGEIREGSLKITDHTPRVSDMVTRRLPQYLLKCGDIVFGRKGGVERSALIRKAQDGWFLGSDGISIRPSQDCHSEYLALQFRSARVQSWLRQHAIGTTMPSLNQGILNSVVIPVPPTKAEQEAIAETLSDTDTLIESLEQLVAKKRQMMQGVMQQLLTGKRRLPGFNDDWVERSLGQIAPLQRGFDLPTTQLATGPYPVVYSNGVLNYHKAFQAKGPGVVTGRSGTIGAVTFVESDFWPHNTALWVTSFRDNDPKFVFYLYTLIGLEQFATGSGVPTLNRNDVHAHKADVPRTKTEQVAIAEVLTQLDAQLAALDLKIAKVRQLKKGMMQELLTGRTRLV